MPKRDEGPLAERATYKAFHMVSTRWADNDQYGHINNAKFYEFVDSAVNSHLLIADALTESIGLVVDSGCRYTSSLKFPDVIEVGIKVDHVGTSSVNYGFAVFRRGANAPAAIGHFVHVYVDAETRRPKPLPERLRAVVENLKAD
ncbi:MAG: acyl-CoA thioesterase [Brevundimonas sp.]|jgi:acyl-CoA thioester hydrolase|uniref:acyl-CoA thioesterase n=1 Tax=Brevundimonas sp. TaxID=1871086 RepID=UPI001A1EB30B|nr:thioesterase family protein [Brevundimonas sp.]MBJ7447477.1 acyl-CoA thioesterase [Brevundimonas sp.]